MKIPAVESYVMVLQPQTPNIIINGSNNIAREYQDFRGGVRIFPELKITIDHDEKRKLFNYAYIISRCFFFFFKVNLKYTSTNI